MFGREFGASVFTFILGRRLLKQVAILEVERPQLPGRDVDLEEFSKELSYLSEREEGRRV